MMILVVDGGKFVALALWCRGCGGAPGCAPRSMRRTWARSNRLAVVD